MHSFIAQQLGKTRNKEFLATDDIRASILRHAEKVYLLNFVNKFFNLFNLGGSRSNLY